MRAGSSTFALLGRKAWQPSALEGLAALHAAGEVHGDLRLGNLILTPSRGLVLTDPLGSGDGTPATDLHAWGRLLAELLTGATAKQLSAASGFRPEVARLWEQSQAVHPPRAVDIASTVAALRRSL